MKPKLVDVRQMKRTGMYRLRFYDCYEDQLPNIKAALEIAREEMETEHDTQALEMICVHYLANG